MRQKSLYKWMVFLVLGFAIILGISVPNEAQLNQSATVERWDIPTFDSLPSDIDYDPIDNLVFFSEFSGGNIGQLNPFSNEITEWGINGNPNGIAVARGSGNAAILLPPTVYYADSLGDAVTTLDTVSGNYGQYFLPQNGNFPNRVSLDLSQFQPRVFFSERLGSAVGLLDLTQPIATLSNSSAINVTPVAPSAVSSNVGTFNLSPLSFPSILGPAAQAIPSSMSGAISEWDLSGMMFNGGTVDDVAVQVNGNVWIAFGSENLIAEMDPQTNTFLLYSLPTGSSAARLAFDIAGNVWYTTGFSQKIGMVVPLTGDVMEWSLPNGGQPLDITTDALTGLVWFTLREGNAIGVLNPGTGEYSEYALPSNSSPVALTQDPNGDIWFVAERGNYVGRLSISALGQPPSPGPSNPGGNSGNNGQTFVSGLGVNLSGNLTEAEISINLNYSGNQGLPVFIEAIPVNNGSDVSGFGFLPGRVEQAGTSIAFTDTIWNGGFCTNTNGLKIILFDGNGSIFYEQIVDISIDWGCNV